MPEDEHQHDHVHHAVNAAGEEVSAATPHKHEHRHRSWTKQDTKILRDSETLFKDVRRALKALDTWSLDVNHHIPPETLDEEFRERITHVMWKADILGLVVNAPDPGHAISSVLQWMQEYAPPGMLKVKLMTQEEFEGMEPPERPGQYL